MYSVGSPGVIEIQQDSENFVSFVVTNVEYVVFLDVRFDNEAPVACRSLYAR